MAPPRGLSTPRALNVIMKETRNSTFIFFLNDLHHILHARMCNISYGSRILPSPPGSKTTSTLQITFYILHLSFFALPFTTHLGNGYTSNLNISPNRHVASTAQSALNATCRTITWNMLSDHHPEHDIRMSLSALSNRWQAAGSSPYKTII